MTRISTKELFTPFKDPQRKFRSSGKLFKTLSLDESRSPEFDLFSDLEENSEEEVTKTMAEIMEEYMSKTRANYGSGIARPKIDDKDHFELKGQFLKELRDNTFSGSDHEDANEYIEKVLEIVDLFHIPNITQTIQAQLDNLGREIKKINEKVYAAQVGCEQCKGPHYTKDYPLKEEGKTLEEAYYTQFVAPFQQGGQYRAAAQGFYQRTKRHEEKSNLIKEIRASMDAAIRNQGASIKTLEIQIGKMSKVLQERGFRSLPSSTETNLRDHVKSISTIVEANTTPIRRIGSPQYAKKDYFEGRDEKIIFKSVKLASSLIKRVYMLSLRERMELDLKARLMGETLVLNRSLDPLYGDYIELNDLNVPLELKRDQVDDLMPTVEEVVKNMDGYRDQDIGDVIFGEPFCKASCVEARRFDGLITIHNGNDNVTYQMARSHPRFKHLSNAQCHKIRLLLKVSVHNKLNGISHPYQKLKSFYKGVLNLRPEYIQDTKMEEWLTRGHISVHEME
ncbi:hypothetical protein Tco_1056438 [Tanacetum coccineum]|uniref:Uncharacterized protein n=1 Tax=Tanacetum coccineum TaxID=301880 RepID=A0ABQ5H2N8_9ASTR